MTDFKTFVRSLRCCLVQLGANVKFTFLPHEGAKNTWKREPFEKDSNAASSVAVLTTTSQHKDKTNITLKPRISQKTLALYAGCYLYHSLAGFYESEVPNGVHFITSESVIHGIFYIYLYSFSYCTQTTLCKNFTDLCVNSFFFPSFQ